MKRPEQIFQQKLMAWCYNNIDNTKCDYWCTNNNSSSRNMGYINKKMGVKKGVPDLTFCWGPHGYLELKWGSNDLEPEQEEFLDRMKARGHYTGVAWSLDEAIKILHHWGVPLAPPEKLSDEDWKNMGL